MGTFLSIAESDKVTALATTPDGRWVISGTNGGAIRVWSLDDGTLAGTMTGHDWMVLCLVVTKDGKFLISGSADGTVKTWDMATGRQLWCSQPQDAWVCALALTPDGKYVISADDILKIWDLNTGALSRTVRNDQTQGVWSIAVTPDGQRVVSGAIDSTVKVLDLGNGTLLDMIEGGIFKGSAVRNGKVRSLALTADGTHVIFSDGRVKITDMARHKSFSVLDAKSATRKIALSSDGRYLAAACTDKSISVWNIENGRLIQTLTGHTERIEALIFTPDGKKLISGAYDKTIRIWNLITP